MKRILKYTLLPLFIIVVLWASYFFVYGNFHKVDKDVYRSAQLFSYNLPYYLEKYDIKSILNLRKVRKSKNKSWYKDEVAIAKKLGVLRYDHPIGDREEASIEEMDKIIQIIKDAPKPLLIHCKAGADRTSLASALYLYAVKHEDNAEREISVLYGHFPWLGSKTGAMDKSFEKYKKEKKYVK
jgi:undecaprenyl-diphosphatase